MNNPFWLYEAVVESNPRGVVIFPTSQHLRRSKAVEHADNIRKLIGDHPESKVITTGVRYRFERGVRMTMPQAITIIAMLFVLAVVMRSTGFEFPLWVRVPMWCVIVLSLVDTYLRDKERKAK
jgi:hypothetical protein